jgi:hypothetical protein
MTPNRFRCSSVILIPAQAQPTENKHQDSTGIPCRRSADARETEIRCGLAKLWSAPRRNSKGKKMSRLNLIMEGRPILTICLLCTFGLLVSLTVLMNGEVESGAGF